MTTIMTLDPILTRRREIQRLAAASLGRRKFLSRFFTVLCIACLAVALIPLVAILYYVVERGISAWNASFFTNLPTPAGIPGGGISNAIVGSLIIDGIAAAGAIPFGLLIGMYLAESDGRIAGSLRFAADVMAGVPSITIGVFAYALLVTTLGHFSAISASFALGVLMLPVIARATETSVSSVPSELVDAGLSLGGRRAIIARRVVLPVALPGLITGILLALARAMGETAPLLFTAIGSQFWAVNPLQPVNAMPLVIYQNGIQAYPDLQQVAWGTGLFLVLIILVLNIGARVVAARLRRVRR